MSRPTLTPEMLLFEIAAMCSRHGIPVSADNPAAARHHAEALMGSLGLVVPARTPAELPAAPEPAMVSTAVLPRIPADEPHLPPDVLAMPLPPRRPLDGRSFDRGQHRPGAVRTLRSVED